VTFFDKSDGCNKFQAEEAVEFCKSIGGQVVSLDSNEKALAMMDLLRQRAQRYMWTGGRIDHNAGVVTWPSGAREGYVRGQRFWSPTGGKKPTPEPNLTTVTAMKSALESSTTSTPMVSNGMTFLATTKNQLFVNFKSMDTNRSQVELTNIMKHSIAHYCLNCEKKSFAHYY
jgi:hypothetical protein